MSSNNTQFSGNNRMQVNTNLAKVFPFKKELKNYSYTNSTGVTKTWLAGTVMGVVAATGKVLPVASAAVDGSAIPIGVLAKDVTVADGVTINVPVAVHGTHVREDMLLFQGADTISTNVLIAANYGMRYREHLITRGILPIPASNAVTTDNDLA